MYGITFLAIVPVRLEPKDSSEQVTQLLYGEHFKIIEKTLKWIKIEIAYDKYIGYIDSKQYTEISEEDYLWLNENTNIYNSDLVEYVSTSLHQLIPITIGSSLAFLDNEDINTQKHTFEGVKYCGIKPKSEIINTAFLYLNAPYLWGGKSAFGIDCSGFTQMVYKLNGYYLPRDAWQQAQKGETLSFIEESEPGDLAFFDNDEGKIVHVGILMENNFIIHASGKVRIDRLDHLGIYNPETNRHTHKLRVIKKII